jgi:hypothetical protein
MLLFDVIMIPTGGLKKFLPLYNFVGNLEKSWLHGPQLLKRLGIWEEYGARQWSLANLITSPVSPSNTPSRYNFPNKPKVSDEKY